MTNDSTEEPLVESAPLARQLAARLCRTDPETCLRCDWNHGLWQYLRMLGLVTSPAHHAAFFRHGLGSVRPAADPLRILVSGSADYGMLAQVLAALAPFEAGEISVTVVDICATPLALNRWYAGRAGRRIETVQCDILEHSAAEPYDVVCAHAFLAMFPAERRPALLGRWHSLLRPGGRVITVNRLRPTHDTPAVAFAGDQAREFCELVRARALALGDRLPIDPLELQREAARYASRQTVHPVRSAEEVRALFEDAGFRVEHLGCEPVASAERNPISAPTVPGAADYARVIAIRP